MASKNNTVDPVTLKVGELIDLLSKYSRDIEVYGDHSHDVRIIDVDYEGRGPKVFLHISYPTYSIVNLEGKEDDLG